MRKKQFSAATCILEDPRDDAMNFIRLYNSNNFKSNQRIKCPTMFQKKSMKIFQTQITIAGVLSRSHIFYLCEVRRVAAQAIRNTFKPVNSNFQIK